MLFGFPFSETHWLELNDDMVRIASANCGSVEAQTFTYDPFGNLNKVGNPGQSFQPIYAMTRNRISTVGSTTAQYDNNGNVLNDGVNTYTWDADGNSITVDTVGATFDALDRMVEQNRSSVYTEIVYAPTGAKLALMSGTTGQTLQNAFINLPGKATAVYTSSGLDHYRHSDWLGSARLTSSPSRTVLSATAYAPFGETYATYPNPSASADPSFTGQNSDTVSGDYDFLYREYSTQGRWPSPDPAGQAVANPMNPQSWNRYAYVLNNPLGFTDPLGLTCQWDDGTVDWTGESEEGDNQNACESAGGTWVPAAPGATTVVVTASPNDYTQTIVVWIDPSDPTSSNDSSGGGPIGLNIWNCPDATGYDACANTWKQSDCVVNKPFTTAADDLKWATGGAAFVGLSGSMHSGARAMLKGAIKEVGADVVTVAALGAIYFHAIVSTGYSLVAGCKDD